MSPRNPTHWLGIVMPMLNEAQAIAQTLSRLQPWRQAGAQLVVVDGGSTDASCRLAEPLVDDMVHSSAGRALQMNAGAAVARCDYLMFVHADTDLHRIDVERFKSLLARKRPAWGRFDVTIVGESPWLKVVAWMMNMRSRLTGIATGDQCIFIERSLFEQLGGFPQQRLMEDIELCKRLRRLSTHRYASVLNYGRPLFLRWKVVTSGRRWDANGVSKTIWMMWTLRWMYWRGHSADDLAAVYQSMKRGA